MVLQIIIKSFVIYIALYVIIRVTGNKEISQITFFDFIVAITIGSIAGATSIDETVTIPMGIASMTVWAGITILLGFISMKSVRARKLLEGEPTLLIQNGKIMRDNMKKIRFNLEDLLIQLRNKGIFNISEVEFAMLEPDGKVSAILKSQFRPVTPNDLNVSTKYEGLPAELIVDGDIIEENLKETGLNKGWLYTQLRNYGIESESKVTYASLETDGTLYVSVKEDHPEHLQRIPD